jgi:hypothetical protein
MSEIAEIINHPDMESFVAAFRASIEHSHTPGGVWVASVRFVSSDAERIYFRHGGCEHELTGDGAELKARFDQAASS